MSIRDRFIPTTFRRQHVSSDKEWWKRAGDGLPCWSCGWDAVLLLQGMQVPSLVRELRSHMPQGQKKKKTKNDGIPSKWLHTASLLLSVGEIILFLSVQFSSVAQSCLTLCHPMNRSTPGPPCPSPTPRVHSDSCLSSWWCHPAISSSVIPFSSCPQSYPASESFPMSQLFTWGGQSTGVSASASFLPMNTQDWSPLGWTGWTSLQSKGLSRVFSNTTVQKHQFFGAQLSSQSNSHIHRWPLEEP